MNRRIRAGLRALDQGLAASSLRLKRERPALLAFVFHSLFENAREVDAGVVDPYQPVLVNHFERFIEYFLEHGYRFVSPRQILDGLDASGHHVLLTLDDGYANSLRAIPVVRQFGIPATVFVSANHIAEGKAFWWDTLYRERRRRGVSETAIRTEQAALKLKPHQGIDAYLRAEFGDAGLQPVDDIDRPLTPGELKDLLAEPLVTVGNHTADHAILTLHDDHEARNQIATCQKYLTELTSSAPEIIAYPNANFDDRIIRIARAEGLRLGVVVEPRKNRLPLTERTQMTIARYLVQGGDVLLDECQRSRSDIQLQSLRWWLQRAGN